MFHYSGILPYQQQLRDNTTSCEEATLHYLRQIEDFKHLNAFVSVFTETAIVRSRELDQRRAKGLPMRSLHGVIIALKDVICYAGHPVSAASKMLKGFTPVYHASAVQFLLDEEAILIGSCNCDEFAMGSSNENSFYGPVINGKGQHMVPGGSSGGSAVAVQTGQCMISLGSDTGGSVRQPADFCGVIGFKPGYGMVSRYGLIAYASSFDQIGIFGKYLADVQKVFEVIAQPDPRDTTMNQEKKTASPIKTSPRLGYFKEMLNHPSLDPEIGKVIRQKLEKLKADGLEVKEFDFPLIDYIVPAYYVLTTAEAGSNLLRYDGIRYGHREQNSETDLVSFYKQNRSNGFGKEVKKRIMLGTFVLSAGYYDAYYQKAQQVRGKLISHLQSVFQKIDYLVLPNSPVTAWPIGSLKNDPVAVYLADIFTVYANLTGVPAISLPAFIHSNNMPFGFQLIAARGEDVNLLQMATAIFDGKENTHI